MHSISVCDKSTCNVSVVLCAEDPQEYEIDSQQESENNKTDSRCDQQEDADIPNDTEKAESLISPETALESSFHMKHSPVDPPGDQCQKLKVMPLMKPSLKKLELKKPFVPSVTPLIEEEEGKWCTQ